MREYTEKNNPEHLYTDVILDSVADGVFTVDLEWNITSLNRAGEKLLGITRARAIGKKCFDIFRADICQSACPLRYSIKNGREMINVRADIINRHGQKIPVSVSTAVIKDSAGTVVGGVETFRDLSALEMLRKEIHDRYTFEDIISRNHEIRKIFNILPDIAESGSNVLVEGPSGSGKELFARALHSLSLRRGNRFIAVNCGAIPDTLLESELFGYVKGAFTGADRDKPGRFVLAEGGTVLLDEIGDISRPMQVKLLRFLQEKEYEPLGTSETRQADVRIISATNRDLAGLVAQGMFREDLYYRLNVIKISLPPLVRRREDVPLLVDHFIREFNIKKNKNIESVSDEAMSLLMAYDFPGNVRELENIIEHAFILCHGTIITRDHFPAEIRARELPCNGNDDSAAKNKLGHLEAEMIVEMLKKNNGNRKKTSAELGMNPATLWRKMKKHHIVYP